MDPSQECPYVFIDTCIFVSQNFQFCNSQLTRVLLLASEGVIDLILTDVTEQEVKRKIRERAETFNAAHSKLNNILRSAGLNLPPSITQHTVREGMLGRFRDFLETCSVNTISTRDIEFGPVLDAWREFRPPFSRKKPNEFRDAFVAEGLRRLPPDGRPLFITTTDPDFDNVLLDGRPVHVVDLTGLLKEFEPKTPLYNHTHCVQLVQQLVQESHTSLATDFQLLEFVIQGSSNEDSTLDRIHVQEISPGEVTILAAPPDLVATATVTFSYTLYASYMNPGSRVDFYAHPFIDTPISGELVLPVEVSCTIEGDHPKHIRVALGEVEEPVVAVPA